MSDLPVVGVVVANHNYGKWLKTGIEKLAEQNYPLDKIKVGIFHDACTDNSADTVRETEANLSLQPILHIENNGGPIGPALGRNEVIKEMWDEVDCFMILDADDYYGPNKIKRSVEEWTKLPEQIGVVYSDHEMLYDIDDKPTYTIDRFLTSFDYSRLQQNNIVHSNSLISKLAIAECGLYEDMYPVEDYDMWLRIGKKFMIVHIPEILMTARITGVNASYSCGSETWQNRWRQIREKHAI